MNRSVQKILRLFPQQIYSRTFLTSTCQLNNQDRTWISMDVLYKEHGDPSEVCCNRVTVLPPTTSCQNSVLVRMLAAPINPADINMIQGVYPVKPPLPAVGGNEGVGEVICVGDNVKRFKLGDRVIMSKSGCGTWRTKIECKEDDIIKIDKNLPVESAATLAVNPCTAYRMLVDFVHLCPGDYVIQNGANSAVGQIVMQLAANKFNLKTINVVRKRENECDMKALTDQLLDLGATHVITDEFLRSRDMKDFMRCIPAPKLGLNCVGGKSTADLAKYMAEDGVVVTYGGMSKQPIMIPAGSLIFKNISFKGFWMTKWNELHQDSPERYEMISELSKMILSCKLKTPPMERVPFHCYKKCIKNALKGFEKKQLLIIRDK